MACGKRKSETTDDAFPILAETYARTPPQDLTKAPGMVHLRNSILTDGNYVWENPVSTDDWRWCLQFTDGGVTARCSSTKISRFSADLNRRADEVRTVDCRPLAETLREYFGSIDAFLRKRRAAKPQAAASKEAD